MIHCFPHEEETEKVLRYILKLERERDYYPTQDVKKRIVTLQRILDRLNYEAGPYKG